MPWDKDGVNIIILSPVARPGMPFEGIWSCLQCIIIAMWHMTHFSFWNLYAKAITSFALTGLFFLFFSKKGNWPCLIKLKKAVNNQEKFCNCKRFSDQDYFESKWLDLCIICPLRAFGHASNASKLQCVVSWNCNAPFARCVSKFNDWKLNFFLRE